MSKNPSASRRKFITAGIADLKISDPPSRVKSRSDKLAQSNRQHSHVEYYSKKAMACQFELLFNMHQYSTSAEYALQALAMIDDLENQMSIYREQSELSQINRKAYRQSMQVETGLFELLTLAQNIQQQTSGAFDITASPLSALWGFHRREGRVPEQCEIEFTLNCVGMQNVVLQPESCELTFLGEKVKLDPGGIGKGYAIDRAAELLLQSGIHDFVFHGGQSSVIARGSCLSAHKPGNTTPGWRIGISHPQIPECRMAEIELVNKALGTSGTQRQGFFYEGRHFGHIIDPRTGYPTDHCLSSTVICQSAARADALATAFFVMTRRDVQAFCDQQSDISAVMVYPASERSAISIEAFNCDRLAWRILI